MSFPLSTNCAIWMLLVVSCATTGCNWLNPFTRRAPKALPPVVLENNANKDALLQVIAANGQRVQSLQTQSATVQVPGAPAINANFAFEKPMKLRFRAGSFLGQEVDLGSNQEQFWFWVRQMPNPSLFYARHDQFAASSMRQNLPIEPHWIPESLGLIDINAASAIEGPIPVDAQLVELRLKETGAIGPYTRVLRVHRQYGVIQEQYIMDSQNQMIVAARASDYQHYAAEGVSLPRKIELKIPQAQMQLTMNIPSYVLNQPTGDNGMMFQLPKEELANYPAVDLANPHGGAGTMNTSVPNPGTQNPADAPPLGSYFVEPIQREEDPIQTANSTDATFVPRYRGQPASSLRY